MKNPKNSVHLIGHSGNDPVIRVTQNNRKHARFSICQNDKYKDRDGEWHENENWFNCVAWGSMATRVETLVKKGCRIDIEGRIASRSYIGKDGGRRYITEIVIEQLLVTPAKVQVETT